MAMEGGKIQPAGFSQYGHTTTRGRVLLRPMGYANISGVIASEVSKIRLEQDSVYDADPRRDTRDATGWEYLEIGTNISEEYATSLSKDDIIKIRGTITVCELSRGVCIRIGPPIAIDPNAKTNPGTKTSESAVTPHEARKTRAAILINYITQIGNEIDRLNTNGQNPRNYWRAIIDAQNELLQIYRAELAFAKDDPDATRILKANIVKIDRGQNSLGTSQELPLASSFREKLYNRCSAHSTPVAPAAPLRHRAFLASGPAAGALLDAC